ncbi:hypothetical protein [Ligilactobacillus ceti]|uniref:Integrase recombinase xerD n=1 Tax=Ligilactobacillus ceti DSM 22408 TaxID=1122146 RepID=A0A0R2KHC3_9LACO|nr:hypothetical protein [Ligilactobacillus ceti]KRN88766.1 integrase recombinase xerD [Ligilactobacillus ceti DSM 22408]
MHDFPYKKRFVKDLEDKYLESITIRDTCHDVADLFNYLRHFNYQYQISPELSQLQETDIKAYLNMLQVERKIKNTTYNKVLTHLNTYFNFLFINNLSTSLPTLKLKGLKRTTSSQIPFDWTENCQQYLADEQLSYYTRMVLLLTSHFYTISEFLQPDFYRVLERETWTEQEAQFLKEYQKALAPLQNLQASSDLFLKKRINLAEPNLTLAGLHKFLKKDQAQCDLKLIPRDLYQNSVRYYLQTHQTLTDQALMQKLRLDEKSLNYYRQSNNSYSK